MKINKEKLARMIAKKGDFRLEDANLIIDILIEIFEEVVVNRWSFSVNGLGKFVFSKKKAHRNMDMNLGKMVDIPEAKTVRFELSALLKQLAKE